MKLQFNYKLCEYLLQLEMKSESDDHEVRATRDAAFPAQSDIVTDLTLVPRSSSGGKHKNKSRVPKHAKSVTQRLDAGNVLLHC